MANKPRIIIFCRSSKQMVWAKAFQQGLRTHGITAPIHPRAERLNTLAPDVAIFWSHKRYPIIEHQRRRGAHYIVMEHGYFNDRRKFSSFGWDGLNGRADFCNRGMPGDRWALHGVPVKPWKEGGEYALIIGQKPGDASHAHASIDQWYLDMAREWGAHMPVLFRHHPKGEWPSVSAFPHIQVHQGTLDEALAGAAVAVTFSSNTAVEAAIAGVPVYAHDEGSMAYEVASHTPGEIIRPERTQWLHDLAYAQWTAGELLTGKVWSHVSQKLEDSRHG